VHEAGHDAAGQAPRRQDQRQAERDPPAVVAERQGHAEEEPYDRTGDGGEKRVPPHRAEGDGEEETRHRDTVAFGRYPPDVREGPTVAVIKTIELVGVSPSDWTDAANRALAEAAKTLRGIEGMEILDQTAVVKDNAVSEYQATVRIRFRLEDRA
jgi:flavin-binding protein dodecin